MKNPKNIVISTFDILYSNKSQITKFYLVGFTGLIINLLLSYSFHTFYGLEQIYASIIGISVSITSNFIFNKFFTFKNKDLSFYGIFSQYLKYITFNFIGVILQITIVALLKDLDFDYSFVVIIAVGIASIANYIFNKKFTFNFATNKTEIKNE